MSQPLSGVVVVSQAVNGPGPVAVARLVDLGARGIVVQPPDGDPLERYAPGWYADLSRRLEVRRLDLKDPAQRRELDLLLAGADVLVTATRPAALARLGLDWSHLHEALPRLVHTSIVGRAGERADVPGHDLTYQAAAGILTPPAAPRTLAADLAGAERAVSETLAGLLLRERTGEGTLREVGLGDCADDLGAPVRRGMTTPGSLLGGGFAGYGLYAARGGHVALAALEPHFWARAQELLGADHGQIAATLAGRSPDEWEAWGEEHDVPLAAVREPERDPACEHEHEHEHEREVTA